MNMIADSVMAITALALAVYCITLGRRLKRFTKLEAGMGSAIAVLSVQVDEMTQALAKARDAAATSTGNLDGKVARAEAATARLELLLASLHDVPPSTLETAELTPKARKPRFVRQRPSDVFAGAAQ